MHQRTKLSNGIVVASEQIPSVRSVSVGLWLRTGSVNEKQQNNGVSHLIEHMMFKGTAKHTAKEIAEAMDGIGGQLNAFTSREYTCYYARVLDEHLEFALTILSEMLRASQLAPQELEKERGVVLEEINMYQDEPDELVHDLFVKTIFGDHPLGRPILGTVETVSTLSREDLIDYITKYYTPQRLLVAAAGNVKQEELAGIVQAHLGDYTAQAAADEFDSIKYRGKIATGFKQTEQVHLILGAPGLSRSDPGRYTLEVLESLLGSGMSSRLFQELREERGLVYTTYSFHSLYRDHGLWGAYAATGKAQAQTVIDAMVEQFIRIASEPVSDCELARAKQKLKGCLLIGLESTSNRMSRIAKDELFMQENTTPQEEIERIEAVTAGELQRLSQRLLSGGLSLCAIGPIEKGELTLPSLGVSKEPSPEQA